MRKAGGCGITVTFGEVCENHVNMQKLGTLANRGFAVADLERVRGRLSSEGLGCELIDLATPLRLLRGPRLEVEEAAVLVVRNGLSWFAGGHDGASSLLPALQALSWDTKAKMYGRVVDKKARHNLCFADLDQEPNYEEGMGRVVAFGRVPALERCREQLTAVLGEAAASLFAEGNMYYDVNKCGIGYHGDSERRKVAAIRLGASFPICFQWFSNHAAVGERVQIDLNHGDMYFMSEKAVGTDWKKSSIFTLRHAAGCDKFIVHKVKGKDKKSNLSKKKAATKKAKEAE